MAFKKNSTLYESPPPVFVQCCFSGCPNNANVRMFTKTGWANVCARVDKKDTTGIYHYDKLEREPRMTRNIVMDELREAYRKSPHYRRSQGGAVSEGHVSQKLRDKKFEEMMADLGEP